MERVKLSPAPSGVQINGYPNAARVVAVDGELAEYLQDLALHHGDLVFARCCLDAIPNVPDQLGVVHQALWRAAIVHFIKCFDTGARVRLDRDAIYTQIDQAEIARQCFDYFHALRNRHDVNDYAQAAAGAVINHRGSPYKIEKVVCISLLGETLNPENYGNLRLLINVAADWVGSQFDELATGITAELEVVDYDRLIQMPPLNQKAPKLESIARARRQPRAPPA